MKGLGWIGMDWDWDGLGLKWKHFCQSANTKFVSSKVAQYMMKFEKGNGIYSTLNTVPLIQFQKYPLKIFPNQKIHVHSKSNFLSLR